ncbi:endolytic transglycosylase MltG [Cellulomonas massiliensis]|uniref:endolytic transglycosylase MltG n=1 Tax=Cellulomonas massiliensis TaxID=1465811 RepID=UPI0002D2D6DB|nr:endolytic transglycosylase MltG [Cellulomonas massiliensis]
MTDLFPSEPADVQPSRRDRSGAGAGPSRRRRQERRRTAVVVVVVLGLLLGAGFVVYSLLGDLLPDGSGGGGSAQDYPGPGSGSATVVVAQGDTGADIGASLVEAGVVASTQAFTEAFEANPDSGQIQPGTYRLLQAMPAAQAVESLLDPSSRELLKVTIPEGLTAEQIVERISEKTLIPVDELKKTLKDGDSYGLPKQAKGEPEGWLFPATYEIDGEPSAAGILEQMTAKTVAVLRGLDVPKDEWETTLIKASIVEREAKRDEDRGKVARGIDNRLAKPMLLQIDATVAYGLEDGQTLSAKTKADASNPYNTYVHEGLPPTPIASPGQKSIEAAVDPTPGDWLFWATVNFDTGETLFTADYAQHQRNLEQMREWVAEHQ